jgi:hypothetical protein
MDSRERSSHLVSVDGGDGRYYVRHNLWHSSSTSDQKYSTSLSTSISSHSNNNNNNNNNKTGNGNNVSSNIDSLKSSLTSTSASGGSYTCNPSTSNPTSNSNSNYLSSSTTTTTSFHTAASSSGTNPVRNTVTGHSPQLRLNVENGNVDFTSPIITGISRKDIHGNPLNLSLLNTTDSSTSDKCEKKFNLSLSSSSPSSPSFSNTSPFPDFIPNMESVIRKSNYPMMTPEKRREELDAETIREKLSSYEREKKKDPNIITAGSVRDNIRKIEKEKEKEKDQEREFEREREEIRNSTPLSKSDLRPPRVNRTVSLPVAMKVQGTYLTPHTVIHPLDFLLLAVQYHPHTTLLYFLPYECIYLLFPYTPLHSTPFSTLSSPVPPPHTHLSGKGLPYPARNLDSIAEIDPQPSPSPSIPISKYEYSQKMNSAPVSPAKKVRPGSAGVVGLVPRLENWNPLNGSKGVGREEGGRERSKRSLMSGIVEAQSHSQSSLGGIGGGGGGGIGGSVGSRDRESHTHHRQFKVGDRASSLRREDSASAAVTSHHNTSSRNFENSDVTYANDSVHMDDENNPLSPSWGRSRSHSTGTGTTSHVNDSSISTGSSGFFSRLLATPSKHLRKKNDQDCTSHYRKERSDRDSEKERERGDEESVGSRGGGSVERTVGYDPYLREENVHDDSAFIRSKLCLRVNVKSSSRYRLCDSNPQEEGDATWACATGVFQQSFILRGDICELEDRLVASDRLVTVVMDSRITNNNGDIRVENTTTTDNTNTTDFQYSDSQDNNADKDKDKSDDKEDREKDNENPDLEKEKEKPKREVKVY